VEAIITRKEKLQAIRWINLAVGLVQIHYWLEGASILTFLIAAANIAVFAFTKK
jgi:hypothetical protein